VPGVCDGALIGQIAAAVRSPLNLLATIGTPSIARLKELGVARVSVGSGIARAALGLTRRTGEELKTSGTFRTMLEGTIPFAEVNRFFEPR
jgi:2-methylisocitrate lyase-like PEP mutase family enzyme